MGTDATPTTSETPQPNQAELNTELDAIRAISGALMGLSAEGRERVVLHVSRYFRLGFGRVW